MTQEQLGGLIHVKGSYIAKIENGDQRGSYEKLAAISLVLEIPWATMMKVGDISIPVWDGTLDHASPFMDAMLSRYHPKVKAMLYEIAPILQKWVEDYPPLPESSPEKEP